MAQEPAEIDVTGPYRVTIPVDVFNATLNGDGSIEVHDFGSHDVDIPDDRDVDLSLYNDWDTGRTLEARFEVDESHELHPNYSDE